MSKKKVLIFVDWYIPAFKAGGPIRSVYNLVTRLSDEFEFHIITGDRDLGDDSPYGETNFDVWQKIGEANVIYLSKKNQNLKRFKSLMKEIDPDTIYLNSLFSFTFTLVPLWLKKRFPKAKYVLAPRGMLGKGALEIKKKKKEVFIALARLVKLYKGIVWHATNKKERKEVLKAFGKQNHVLIADNLATPPVYSFEKIAKMKLESFETKRFLFVSRISRKKNVDKLIQWFLDISMEHTNFTLDIIGTIEEKNYYKELLDLIGKNSAITIQDAIHPKVLVNNYAKAHFFCLPTRHENYGHVIIEAFSYGCPVIISRRTPWRKLKKDNIGWDLPLDKPEKFISVIKECIEMDADSYLQMSERASMFANEHIHQSEVKIAYRKLLS